MRYARLLRSAVALLTPFGFGVATAFAHDTWLLPTSFTCSGGGVDLELTSGMDFPRPESFVAKERLLATGARLNGETRPLEVGAATKAVLRLRWNGAASGVALLWAQTRPRTLSLEPAQVREYLHEIGAWETAGKRWEAGGAGPWRESYVKVAQTYVRCGVGDDVSWREPAGLDLEIVPEADPTLLRAGDELPVRLLRKGRPLEALAIGAVTAGATPALVNTDADGRANLKLDRSGAWLIRATLLRNAQTPGLDWESVFATLTIGVQPRR